MVSDSDQGLTVQDLTIEQRGRTGSRRLVDDVTVRAQTGRITLVVGESGCGKSLIAAAATGLIPAGLNAPGTVTVAGHTFAVGDTKTWRRLRGHRVGLVPQSAIGSFTPVRTVGSQLRETVLRLHDDTSDPGAVLRALADPVELPRAALDLFPHELSGGLAQRAAIAAALAGKLTALVADEPTSALDPKLAEHVWRLLRDIATDSGIAVLAITHDIERAAAVADTAHVVRVGRIIAHVEPTESHDLDLTDPYLHAFVTPMTPSHTTRSTS